MANRGFFLTIEHADGVGGTWLRDRIAEHFASKDFEVVQTAEPGGTLVGKEIRRLLGLSGETPWELCKPAELLLYQADRAQHVHEVIKPALQRGAFVICDRYVDSTLVYQGRGRGFSEDTLYQLHHIATESLMPDLTVIVTGSPRRDLSAGDRFERDNTLQSTVRGAYLTLAEQGKRYVVVNSNDELATILAQITAAVERKIQDVRIL